MRDDGIQVAKNPGCECIRLPDLLKPFYEDTPDFLSSDLRILTFCAGLPVGFSKNAEGRSERKDPSAAGQMAEFKTRGSRNVYRPFQLLFQREQEGDDRHGNPTGKGGEPDTAR